MNRKELMQAIYGKSEQIDLKEFDNIEGLELSEPETIMEAIEVFERFMIVDFRGKGNNWNEEFLERHFKIFRYHIQRILEKTDLTKNKLL